MTIPRPGGSRRIARPLPRVWILLAILLLMAAGCGGAPRPTTSAAEGPGGPVIAAALQPCPTGAAPVRTQLPPVSLHCLDSGGTLSLGHLPARPFVINLWASWCQPCQREAPRLAAAAAAARGHVGFLGVDTADSPDAALAFLHDFGIGFPQLSDPHSDVLHQLPAPGLPVTVAVDATGRIVYRRIGEITAEQLTAALHAADPIAVAPRGGNN